jgi:hypothetical protein
MNVLVLCADTFTINNNKGIDIALFINKKYNINSSPNMYYVGLDLNIKQFSQNKKIIIENIYNFSLNSSYYNFFDMIIEEDCPEDKSNKKGLGFNENVLSNLINLMKPNCIYITKKSQIYLKKYLSIIENVKIKVPIIFKNKIVNFDEIFFIYKLNNNIKLFKAINLAINIKFQFLSSLGQLSMFSKSDIIAIYYIYIGLINNKNIIDKYSKTEYTHKKKIIINQINSEVKKIMKT